MRQDRTGMPLSILPSSSDERSEIGGPSGAEGDLSAKRGARTFALTGAAGSPRLRRCAAGRRMTKEGAHHLVRIDKMEQPASSGSH